MILVYLVIYWRSRSNCFPNKEQRDSEPNSPRKDIEDEVSSEKDVWNKVLSALQKNVNVKNEANSSNIEGEDEASLHPTITDEALYQDFEDSTSSQNKFENEELSTDLNLDLNELNNTEDQNTRSTALNNSYITSPRSPALHLEKEKTKGGDLFVHHLKHTLLHPLLQMHFVTRRENGPVEKRHLRDLDLLMTKQDEDSPPCRQVGLLQG